MEETRLVKMTLEDGTTICIEGWDMAGESEGPVREVARLDAGQAAAEAARRLSETVRGYTGLIVGALRAAPAGAMPDKATITFGVKIGGEYNVAVAKATGEANVTVTAEWVLRPPAPGP